MDIKVQKDDFLKTIGQVSGAVSSKTNIPVLSNVLLQTINPGQVSLTGTDLELGIRATCPAQVGAEGAITLPAKKLHDIIRELPAGEIEITVAKNNAVNIKTKKSFFKIIGLDPTDFPKLPEPAEKESIKLDQAALKQCLTLTSFAISHDETRYTLNGVLLRFKDGKIKFVATDGKRLAYIEREFAGQNNTDLEVIIPTKTIFELVKNLSDKGVVEVAFQGNQIIFQSNDTTIVSRLIEGRFPNYEQVIPKDEKTTTQLDREEFLAATRRASILTSQENQSIKMDFIKGKVLISSRSPNLGEAKEELDAEVKGDDLSIGFNPGYLIDVLKNLDIDQVSLSLTDPDKPGVIKGNDGYLYVVMPMQLN